MAQLTVPIKVDALELAKEKAKEYYEQGRKDLIKQIKKLEKEGYCPMKSTGKLECAYMEKNESCISCYLKKIEEDGNE